MNTYIARQPIFDRDLKVGGYELLYRDSHFSDRAVFDDGDKATSKLLYSAFTQFSLPKLSNHLPAFINFTDSLILADFPKLVNPSDVVVEILEDVKVSDDLIKKIYELRSDGYKLALDDYIGQKIFDILLPLVDIVKVDFLATNETRQKELAGKLSKYKNLRLLAEKVETVEDFERAKESGFDYFQGYFFEKPKTMHTKTTNLSVTTYTSLMRELSNPDGINFNSVSKIIRKDATLTYKVLQRTQTLAYYRGNAITEVTRALVHMGEADVRRWVYLMVALEENVAHSDELVRQSYLRGVFAEGLMRNCHVWDDPENAFYLGMFSLLDKIFGRPINDILDEIHLPAELSLALCGQKGGFYADLLEYVKIYESGDEDTALPDIGLTIDEKEVAAIYMNSLIETDKFYNA